MADYYPNFPLITELKEQQQAALDCPGPIALSGGPGTGKSFVSLWRHISNYTKENPKKSQLLTFTTSLTYYLKQNCASQSEMAAANVDSFYSWYSSQNESIRNIRDEIIVDEAQDIPLIYYQDPEKLRRLSPEISYGADNKQILQHKAYNPITKEYNLTVCSPAEELNNIFQNNEFDLDRNYRNTKSIMNFAKAFFEDAYIPDNELKSCKEEGDKPRLFITGGDRSKKISTILDIVQQYHEDATHNIGILAPLANRPWDGGEELAAYLYYNHIIGHTKQDGSKIECSMYDYEMQGLRKMKNVHVTTFQSAKGLEFDTVIIPCIDVLKKGLYAVNWRHLFVAVTRAKSNLFLFSDKDINVPETLIDKEIL